MKLLREIDVHLHDDLDNAAGALNPEDATHKQLTDQIAAIRDFIKDHIKRPKGD